MRIIGGGIAGLTTALCLARHGLASHVHERATAFEEVGAGLQLSPNASRILIALGLEAELTRIAVEPERIVLHDGRTGARLNAVPLGALARARYGAPYWVLHRADLQAALLAACRKQPGITLRTGDEVEPGSTARLVLAADGVHSRWRSVVRGNTPPRFTGTIAWRTTLPEPHAGQEPETRVWFGPQAHLVDYPISSGRARNLVAIARKDSPAGMIEAFTRWHPALRARLDAVDGWTPWPLNGVDPSAPWVAGSVALVGDAAHAMLPFAAQGAAMAIEDAWVLAWQLAHSPVEAALPTYERLRRPRVQRVWREAVRNGTIYHATGAVAFGRNAVLRATPPLALLSRYDWLYGWHAGGAGLP